MKALRVLAGLTLGGAMACGELRTLHAQRADEGRMEGGVISDEQSGEKKPLTGWKQTTFQGLDPGDRAKSAGSGSLSGWQTNFGTAAIGQREKDIRSWLEHSTTLARTIMKRTQGNSLSVPAPQQVQMRPTRFERCRRHGLGEEL